MAAKSVETPMLQDAWMAASPASAPLRGTQNLKTASMLLPSGLSTNAAQ